MQTSLLQLRAKKNDPRALVMEQLNQLSTSNKSLAMLAFSAKQALKSRTGVDFSKMLTLLKKEADDALASRDQCNEDFNSSAAEKKETEHAIKGLTATIEELTEVIAAQAAIVEKSTKDIAAAKESMAE